MDESNDGRSLASRLSKQREDWWPRVQPAQIKSNVLEVLASVPEDPAWRAGPGGVEGGGENGGSSRHLTLLCFPTSGSIFCCNTRHVVDILVTRLFSL